MLGFIVDIVLFIIFPIFIGLFLVELMKLCFRKIIAHKALEVQVAKVMSELVAEMRKEGKFTDKQRVFFDNLLDLAESKSFVRLYFKKALFGTSTGRKISSKQFVEKIELLSGFSQDSKSFDKVIALMALSVLGGSTRNFFLGGFFRNLLFADVSRDLKLIKATVKEEVIVYKPIFSNFVEEMPLAV